MQRIPQRILKSDRNRALKIALLTAFVGFNQGCSVGPKYTAPDIQVPSEFQTQLSNAIETQQIQLGEWWTVFDDDLLNNLVDRGLTNNLDIQQAIYRIQESRALRGVSGAALLPTVDTSGAYSRTESSTKLATGAFSPRITNSYQLGIDAKWEIDIWGRNRHSVEAAQADLELTVENTRDVLVSIMGEIALNYVELRTFQERLRIARANVDLQEQTLQLTQSQFDANLVSKLDVSQARSNLESTRSTVPTLISGVHGIENRISVLLGVFPGELRKELSISTSIPTPPTGVMVGVPTDVVRQRADIRAAERALAAQTARVGVATADLYPRLTLSGNIGFQAANSGDLLSSAARTGQFGPTLVWNLFDRKKLRDQIRVEDARVGQALAQYEQVVLVAFEEIENAMIEFQQEQVREEHLALAVIDARTAVELSRDRYRQGLTDFQSVIDTQSRLFQLEDTLATSNGAISTALIRLYKSLGGGWDSRDIIIDEQSMTKEGNS
ncbi:MAG: efflux transporter outer membrane subunit [Phycisphaerales bacterium]|nr:efflux transporter outer membrane subunit [Phycisphaerales bacterium]